MNIVVGVADAGLSGQREDILTTYALGSCIGVSLYDPAAAVGGLLHFQLPSATIDPRRAGGRPLMYADTGMEALLLGLTRLGGNIRRMRVRLAGGRRSTTDQGLFDIGRRNHAAIRKILWLNGMFIEHEMIGENDPVTMQLHIDTGDLFLKCNNETLKR